MSGLSSIIKYLFRISLCVWIISWFFLDRLPPQAEIQPHLYEEPLQSPSSAEKFTIEYKGQHNNVQPVAEYEIHGLIVSHNDPARWYRFDLTHDDISMDTRDLCVLWGDNLKTADYKKISFTNTDWSCQFNWHGPVQFDINKISNNHLITDSETIRKKIATLNIGDQIIIKGKLVNYSEERWNGHMRNTSTTRTDTGNGACEIIYVENLEIIKSYNYLWAQLHQLSSWLAVAMLGLGCILFFRRD